MTVRLPTRDEHTTYDYTEGCKRRRFAREGSLQITEMKTFYAPPDAFRYIEDIQNFEHDFPQRVKRQLRVSNHGETLSEVNQLTKEKTAEFALKAMEKWGNENAQKVLSSSATGSLYWNILFHYGSYDKFIASLQPRN